LFGEDGDGGGGSGQAVGDIPPGDPATTDCSTDDYLIDEPVLPPGGV